MLLVNQLKMEEKERQCLIGLVLFHGGACSQLDLVGFCVVARMFNLLTSHLIQDSFFYQRPDQETRSRWRKRF